MYVCVTPSLVPFTRTHTHTPWPDPGLGPAPECADAIFDISGLQLGYIQKSGALGCRPQFEWKKNSSSVYCV